MRDAHVEMAMKQESRLNSISMEWGTKPDRKRKRKRQQAQR